MPIVEDESKKRLSSLCKRLRGDESVRSFTRKRAEELGGINFSTWSAWERGQAGLGKESLDRLVKFIGCSYQHFNGYLDGLVSLEELFQPSTNLEQREIDFSPEVTREWVKTLNPQDKLFVATHTLQAFQEEFDKLIKVKVKEETKLLLDLLSSNRYPENCKIEETATRLDISVEDLRNLCDRVYLE